MSRRGLAFGVAALGTQRHGYDLVSAGGHVVRDGKVYRADDVAVVGATAAAEHAQGNDRGARRHAVVLAPGDSCAVRAVAAAQLRPRRERGRVQGFAARESHAWLRAVDAAAADFELVVVDEHPGVYYVNVSSRARETLPVQRSVGVEWEVGLENARQTPVGVLGNLVLWIRRRARRLRVLGDDLVLSILATFVLARRAWEKEDLVVLCARVQ